MKQKLEYSREIYQICYVLRHGFWGVALSRVVILVLVA